jgi:hypothetical protein
MTQNEKDLLLKDLCSRLPYGVKLQHVKNPDSIVELYSIDLDDFYCKIKFYTYKGKALIVSDEDKLLKPGETLRYKPCLFPLSSMTEEQKQEYTYIVNYISFDDTDNWKEGEFIYVKQIAQLMHFYHKNHLDYMDLIPMGLAIDATGKNIY